MYSKSFSVQMFCKILYKLLFSREFYFHEFREPDPREKFPLQFMSIYSNDNIRKNHEINHSQITAPSPKTWK